MNDSGPRCLTQLSIHEAGHAVAFNRLFPDFYSWSLSIEPDSDTLGNHGSEGMPLTLKADETKAAQRAKDKAVYMCAGYAAMIVSGYDEERSISVCEADFKEAGVHLDHGK